MDILARDDAPLTDEQWAQLDDMVASTAKKYLTARRLLPIYGPLGVGMPVVPAAEVAGGTEEPIHLSGRKLTLLEELNADFSLNLMHFAEAERMGAPVSFAPALIAAQEIARREDEVLFNGAEETDVPGLLNVEGAHFMEASDWNEEGALVNDFARAVDALGNAGYPGPYGVAISPGTKALAHRILKGSRLEIEILQDLAEAGLYASGILGHRMLVMEVGRANADLALGMDITTTYLDQDERTHIFRIMETLALRMKRPDSIVVLQ
ncbi:MAG: family 1 encapsulin nanocompartment shell protein [Armatimonadota bacterium]